MRHNSTSGPDGWYIEPPGKGEQSLPCSHKDLHVPLLLRHAAAGAADSLGPLWRPLRSCPGQTFHSSLCRPVSAMLHKRLTWASW